MSAPTLKEAYEAGMSAQRTIDKIDRLLEEGAKQCPAVPTYDDWRDQFRVKGEKTLTLQQCKDVVAQKRYGGKNWEEFKSDNPTVVFMEQLMDEVFELGMQSNKGGTP